MALTTEQLKIPFHSIEGQAILSHQDSVHQDNLIRLFKKQLGKTTCGTHSAALLLSAQHIGATQPKLLLSNSVNVDRNLIPPPMIMNFDLDMSNLPYTEANMFSFKETRNVLDRKELEKRGCTLDQLHSLFIEHGFKATKHFSNCTTMDDFREMASKALSHQDSRCGIIVNYDEAALGQWELGSGHFSPLAGYSHAKDSFLLLDTWWDTDDVWVKTSFLFETMCLIDDQTGKSRGFIILEE